MSDFSLTPAAAARIIHLAQTEQAVALRIEVQGGGCSGFQYAFSMVKFPASDDTAIEGHGAKVVIDPVSLDLLKGSSLDYVNELGGSYFSITNPQASSRCGCGNSFSL